MRSKTLFAAAFATVALSGGALAADISPIVIAPPPPVVIPAPPTVAGYIDLHFGILRGYEEFYVDESLEDDDFWMSLLLGGGGRGAYEVTQALNIQLDAWFNFIVNPEQRPARFPRATAMSAAAASAGTSSSIPRAGCMPARSRR